MDFLKGKKTYVLAVVAVGSFFCEMMGWSEFPKEWYGMLGFGSLATMRHGMKK